MNELTVKILEVTPAIVRFNHEEMIAIAKEIAAEYDGRVFTDETVKEAKKTVAELNKIQKSINDFKIKTKKDLTQSVTVFEDQCKQIIAEFDKPKDFIAKQCELFEERRIADKTDRVLALIKSDYEELQIEAQFQSIEIKKEWLNATTTIKEITAEIAYQAQNARQLQNAHYQNVELVKMSVEIDNAKLDVKLDPNQFTNKLKYQSVDEIKQSIESMVESQLKAQEDFKRKAEEKANADAIVKVAEIMQETAKFVPVEANEEEPTRTINVSITGTVGQIDALRAYLKVGGFKVKLI